MAYKYVAAIASDCSFKSPLEKANMAPTLSEYAYALNAVAVSVVKHSSCAPPTGTSATRANESTHRTNDVARRTAKAYPGWNACWCSKEYPSIDNATKCSPSHALKLCARAHTNAPIGFCIPVQESTLPLFLLLISLDVSYDGVVASKVKANANAETRNQSARLRTIRALTSGDAERDADAVLLFPLVPANGTPPTNAPAVSPKARRCASSSSPKAIGTEDVCANATRLRTPSSSSSSPTPRRRISNTRFTREDEDEDEDEDEEEDFADGEFRRVTQCQCQCQ
jgi:hypothetical protein